MTIHDAAARVENVRWTIPNQAFRATCPICAHTLAVSLARTKCLNGCTDDQVTAWFRQAESALETTTHNGNSPERNPPSSAEVKTTSVQAPVEPLPTASAATDLTSWKLKAYDLATDLLNKATRNGSGLLAGTKPQELVDSLSNDLLAAAERQHARLLPLPALSQTELAEEFYNIAAAAVGKWENTLPQSNDAETTPDPILAVIDKALVEVVSANSLSFSTATAFLEGFRSERSKSVALCDGLLRTRNLSLLVGRAWAGKTTLAANLARALVLGERFLGRQCKPETRVAYLALERNGGEVAELFEKWGIADRVLFLDRVPVGEPREMARALAYEIHKKQVEITIVDHLIGMIHLQDGNDYVGVSRALSPFNAIAKYTSSHVFLLHHQPKTAGIGNEINVMGSEAFRAATDCLLEASKIGQNYFFRAQSRGVPDVERLRVFRKDDGLLDAEAGVEGLKLEIINTLSAAEGPCTSAKMMELSPELKSIPIKTVLMAVKRLVDDFHVWRIGKGRRGSPFYYGIGPKPEADEPQPVVGKKGNKPQENLRFG